MAVSVVVRKGFADWRGQLISNHPASGLRSWLCETGSLTLRCQQHCRVFRVRLLRQGIFTPLDDGAGRRCLPVREVLLECDNVPVIFAHSVLSTARSGRLGRWFSRLGNRSLGSLLFTHPGFRRAGIEFCRLDVGHPLHRRVCGVLGQQLPALWARRSRHHLDRCSVLVTEVFMPSLVVQK